MDPYAPYVEAWRTRWADLRRRERERTLRARVALGAIAETLVRHGARRVILFGSLATGRFGLDSDIDVAVEGVAEIFAAAAEAERVSGFTIDLLPLESAFDHVRRRVEREGVILHERTG